jgi:aerobic carbon-monoxide dehydrogenase small subunit
VKQLIQLVVNGESRDLLVHPLRTLLDVLRDDLGLTGTKRGCDLGACGACTVLLDGRPVPSCLTLAVEAGGAAIVTIEGLAEGLAPAGTLHPVQEAFVACGAVQCGFCTPGLVLAAGRSSSSAPRRATTRSARRSRGMSAAARGT